MLTNSLLKLRMTKNKEQKTLAMNHPLFQKFDLSGLQLSNRVVMAPLTRRRADQPQLTANEMMAEYYKQRASAGLIVAEGSQISPEGYGFTGSPGCYSDEQVEAWKKITAGVHKAGGKIFLQLWHVGPWSHRLIQPGGKPPLAASSVTPSGEVLTPVGRLPYQASRAMTHEEIYRTVKEFGRAARNALQAGFDGVEVHGAHSYLIDQFIMDGTNRREDDFGGSIENRARFLFLVMDEVLRHAPASKVGLRLSPRSVKEGMEDSKPEQTYGYIVEKLDDYKLAYLHISEMITPEERLKDPKRSVVPFYRDLYNGVLISCGGHGTESAKLIVDSGVADLVAFGKPFISNPDLVSRLHNGYPLAMYDKSTFYHGGGKGYIDYPGYKKQ